MEFFYIYALLMFPILANLPPVTIGPLQPPVLTQAVPPPPPPFFAGRLEFSFVNTTGNTETTTIGTATGFKLRPGVWLIESESQFMRTTADDALQAESYGSTLRASRSIWRSVDMYGQARYARNTFAGLRYQISADLGLSTAVVHRPHRHRLRADLALGFLHEDRVEEEDRSLVSGTSGLRYAYEFSKHNEFTNYTSITVDLGNVHDFRLQQEAAVAASLNAILSLKFSHTLMYLNQPVAGFRRTDTIGSAALVAKF